MSAKWSTTVLGKDSTDFSKLLKDDFTVILLQGKNTFGDLIYCYLKVAYPDVEKLQNALKTLPNFNASDYGTVIAAGTGEPPDEVRAEIANTYNMLEKPELIQPAKIAADIPPEKKEWDEY